MDEDTKPPSHSVTIVSNLLSIVALGAGIAFPHFGPADQQAVVTTGTLIATGFLQLVSIWGRVRARKRIA